MSTGGGGCLVGHGMVRGDQGARELECVSRMSIWSAENDGMQHHGALRRKVVQLGRGVGTELQDCRSVGSDSEECHLPRALECLE